MCVPANQGLLRRNRDCVFSTAGNQALRGQHRVTCTLELKLSSLHPCSPAAKDSEWTSEGSYGLHKCGERENSDRARQAQGHRRRSRHTKCAAPRASPSCCEHPNHKACTATFTFAGASELCCVWCSKS